MNETTQAELLKAVESLRAEVQALHARVAALEGPVAVAAPVAAAAPVEPVAAEDGLSEEVVLAISAAIAAFLGKRPHIRQIRLIGSGAWAQQGRVSIQASHALAVRHE